MEHDWLNIRGWRQRIPLLELGREGRMDAKHWKDPKYVLTDTPTPNGPAENNYSNKGWVPARVICLPA